MKIQNLVCTVGADTSVTVIKRNGDAYEVKMNTVDYQTLRRSYLVIGHSPHQKNRGSGPEVWVFVPVPRDKGTKKFELLSRYIMKPTDGMIVDHADRDKLNNRRSNLRVCNYSQNGANRSFKRTNKYSLKGITRTSSGKFAAQIVVHKKNIYLGSFDSPELAAMAYDRAAVKHFGRFAKTNYATNKVTV